MIARILMCVLFLVGFFGFATPPAQADGIDFTSASGGGTIGYNGKSTSDLIAKRVPITTVGFTGMSDQNVTGYTCGAGNFTFTCGLLAFTTGSFISKTSNSYTFNGGGSVTVSGIVPGGSGLVTLVSATFANPVNVTLVSGTGGKNSIWQVSGAITVTAADASLTQLFPGLELSSSGALGSLVQIRFMITSTGAFVGTAQSQDVFVPGQMVPEPSSMFLLGTGFVALGTMLRRRGKQV